MTTPLTVTNPLASIDGGLAELVRRLPHDLGVTIRYSPHIPADEIGWWETHTNTVMIADDATTHQQVWLLLQVWQALVIGPSTIVGRVEPLLSLVPAQRGPSG